MWGSWAHLSSADRAAWITAGGTWLTALVGAIALIAASAAAVQAYRTLQVESGREQAAREDRRRAQAALVSAWFDANVPVTPRFSNVGAWLWNASTAPVYDVTVQWFHQVGGEPRDNLTVPVLAPSTEPVPKSCPSGDLRRPFGEDSAGQPLMLESFTEFTVDLQFRDSNGQTWHRDSQGVLTPKN